MKAPFAVGPGLNTADTAFVVEAGAGGPGWVDMDKARFWRGLPESIGGWEKFSATGVTGVCRSLHPWNDLNSALNVAFGTHSNLNLYVGGSMYDITPTLALPPVALGANPLTTQGAGSPNVTFTWNGHPLTTSDTVVISGATAVGGITPNGGPFAVVAVTTNTVTFAYSANATSGATGGGSSVQVAPQRAYAAGAVHGAGGSGFGTGYYSTGGYSQPSTADFFPRTWSFGNFGQTLIANPRGGPIYQWNNATGTPAQPLLNGPVQVTYALVHPKRQIIAIGCSDPLTGIFDPMSVRGCDLEAPTTWAISSTNNAWREKLEGGGRLVAGRMVGDQLFVWSDACLWQAQFIGDPGQTFRFTRLGEECGLIGPNAAVAVGQTAFWLGPDGNFRACSIGGEPRVLLSSVQKGFFENIAPSQQDKIVAAFIPKFGEVWWFYPDARDGNEVSRYVGLNLDGGWWIHGTFDRTAFHAGPGAYPLGVSSGGTVYFHEKGVTADGGAFSWFFESGGFYLGDGEQRVTIKGVWPDFQNQMGPVQLSVYLRGQPQDIDRLKGPFAIAPGQSRRSFLADGRIARIRVAGSGAPTRCRLGKPMFEVEGSGLQ